MYRQKIRLLRRLSGSEILSLLPGKALKLYLVLLVSAKRIGREEVVDMEMVRGALGRALTRRQLLEIGTVLQRHDLAILRPYSRPVKSGGRDGPLCFLLLGRGGRGTYGERTAQAPRAGCG